MVQREQVQKTVVEMRENTKERKFRESVDLSLTVTKDTDLKDSSKRFRIDVIMPHIGEPEKVCVIAEGQSALAARETGATVLEPKDLEALTGNTKEIRKLAQDHDFFLATRPLVVQSVRVLRKLLAPRGKLPIAVSPESEEMLRSVADYQRTMKIQLRKAPVLHTKVGMRDMPEDQLVDNIVFIIGEVAKKLDRGEDNIRSLHVKTTMGPAFKISLK